MFDFYKKSIDNQKHRWYNKKAYRPNAEAFDHWKLNNMKFRALKSADLVKTLWKKKLKKVREAKKQNSEEKILTARAVNIQFFREFDPGSGLTLAACITHSSRTEYRNILSGGRVSNAWVIYLSVRDNNRKQLLIPHKIVASHGAAIKGLLPKDELASD